jgi:hypothetical protein
LSCISIPKHLHQLADKSEGDIIAKQGANLDAFVRAETTMQTYGVVL